MPDYNDNFSSIFPKNGHIVFFDLEYTSWEGSWQRNWSENWEHREVVQIGAVLVDLDCNFKIVDEFNCYVNPAINNHLSDYFIKLTGIRRDEVKSLGVSFSNAYSKFLSFVGNSKKIYANGTDGEVLIENCQLCSIESKLESDKVINFRKWLAIQVSEYQDKQYESIDSGDIIAVLKNQASSRNKHNALYDARCLSEAVKILIDRKSIKKN
jgi:inhibitor of KinA sporulation pathway (predicted exonuclease)